MTVAELITALEKYDGNLEVIIDEYDSPSFKVYGVSSTAEEYPELLKYKDNSVLLMCKR